MVVEINLHATTELSTLHPIIGTSAYEVAANELRTKFSELGIDDRVELNERGKIDVDWENCSSYDDYLDKLESKTFYFTWKKQYDILLYKYNVADGFVWSNEAALGYNRQNVTKSQRGLSVVNAFPHGFDKRVYKNMVIHEFLHGLGVDHNDGNQYEDAFGNLYTSPMATGYTESIRGGNELPEPGDCCDNFKGADWHSGEISNCARDKTDSYLRSELDEYPDNVI